MIIFSGRTDAFNVQFPFGKTQNIVEIANLRPQNYIGGIDGDSR